MYVFPRGPRFHSQPSFCRKAYLILAVVVGAAVGHYIFGAHMDVEAVLSGGGAIGGKSMACH
jgi:hypothetical protein